MTLSPVDELVGLLTEAYRSGLEVSVDGDGRLVRRGRAPDRVVEALRERREELVVLLAGPCVGCGGSVWIREHGTGLPWCRSCCTERGMRLLEVERS